jgi:ABC-type multidrug transport system ATPase subunit
MLVLSALRVEIAGKTIIADASASFERGSATLLVGTNGAGKTTLLRAMAGHLEAAGGTIEWEGASIDARSAGWRQRRVLVEAGGGYLDDFSAAEQLRLRATLLSLDGKEGELRADALEAAFGFEQYRDKRACELSTGFKRRLSLALAFMSDARILFLDEPLNGLDVEGAAALIRILRSYTRAGGTAVIASHIIDPLLQVDDSVTELRDGRLHRHESIEAFSLQVAETQAPAPPEARQWTFPWLARQL